MTSAEALSTGEANDLQEKAGEGARVLVVDDDERNLLAIQTLSLIHI